MATWNSASTTSSSSQRYNLDENDTRDILVYHHRLGNSEKSHLAVESQSSLCKTLDKSFTSNPRWRVSRKRIPRGESSVQVRQEDLWTDMERSEFAKYPNSRLSLAHINLPWLVYWRKLLLNQFQDLYIVSPERSPESSPESSQHVSPSTTFPPDEVRKEDEPSPE